MKWKISSKYPSLSLLWSEIKWNLRSWIISGNVAPPVYQAIWQKFASVFLIPKAIITQDIFVVNKDKTETQHYFLETFQLGMLLLHKSNWWLVEKCIFGVYKSCLTKLFIQVQSRDGTGNLVTEMSFWPSIFEQFLFHSYETYQQKKMDLVKKYIQYRLFVRKIKQYSYIESNSWSYMLYSFLQVLRIMECSKLQLD